jgi:hypothetical protein
MGTLSWGSFPSSASGTGQRPPPGLPPPARAASSGFLSPLTPCSARDPAGLVSYRLRSWGFPSRGLSLPGAGIPLGIPCPSWRPCRRPHEAVVRVRSGSASPCRSGLAPKSGMVRHARTWSWPGAPPGVSSSSWKSVLRVSGGWPLVGADPLLGFHASRGFPRPAWVRPMSHTPLTHFGAGVPKQAATCASECQSAGRWAHLSRDCRPSWLSRPRPEPGRRVAGFRRQRGSPDPGVGHDVDFD